MGGGSSKATSDSATSNQWLPQKSKEFSEVSCIHFPTMDMRNLNTLRSSLCNYNPPSGCMDCINILLVGMVGSGKSSTINTFLSALDPQGTTITCVPIGKNPESLSTKLKSYEEGKIMFWDTSGWNAWGNINRTKRVLHMILDGRVPEGTDLLSLSPDLDVANHEVIPENVIHGVAFVFDMSIINNVSEDQMNIFQELQTIVAQKHIYRVVFGTKFELLGLQEKDYELIYEYRPLQEKFKMLSDLTGMEKRSMFVLSNQWRGDQIEKIKCILALYALENMIRNIDKFLKVTKYRNG